MYTQEHIAALLSVVFEQRAQITELKEQLSEKTKDADRHWRWYTEENEKVKALESALGAQGIKSNVNPSI